MTWASPHAPERARARGIDVQFKRELGADAPEEWRDEIDQTAIPGGIFGEIVFFHKQSKTLILADTIINFELDKMSQPWRFATWLTGMYYPQAKYSSACVCRFYCRGKNREPQLRNFSHGNPKASFSATGAVLSQMVAEYSVACSAGCFKQCERSRAAPWLQCQVTDQK